jgi:hypothetical protein
MDFTIFYRSSYESGEVDCGTGYDLFLSGFDNCDRTKVVFDKIVARNKIWLAFPQYGVVPTTGEYYESPRFEEDEYFIELFLKFPLDSTTRICIDITGFIKPHLVFLMMLLFKSGIKEVDCIYSEPQHYEKAEDTYFSGFPDEPRIIEGFGSSSSTDVENDLLIIAAGYDDQLVAAVSKHKSRIKRKYYILGLPSLQPDMYQESILKLHSAKESIGIGIDRFAPAFDPFVAAQTIQEIIQENPTHNSIYLSPLSTKPHTLGMALYYIWNYQSQPLNIIFPFSKKYSAKSARGLKKTWKYTIEFPDNP